MTTWLYRNELGALLTSIQMLYWPTDLENFSRYISQAIDGLIPCENHRFQVQRRAANPVAVSEETKPRRTFGLPRFRLLKPSRTRKSGA